MSQSFSRASYWVTIFQFALSGLAVLFLWGLSFSLFLAGLFQFSQGFSFQLVDPSSFLMAAGFAWLGALILPSAWFALMRLIARPVSSPHWLTWKNVGVVMWLMVPIVLVGYGAAVTPSLAWLLLPPLNVLALSIPVVWYLSLGGRGLKSSSPQSAWGVFATGLALGPGLILIIELVGGILAVAALGLWLSQEPGFVQEAQRLFEIYQSSSNPNPSDFLPFAETYLMKPSVLAGGLLFVAGFVPLLEELLKPIGLLLMNKRTLTPARGFLAGMMSGAAFGLFENLLQAVSGEEWVLLALGRTGTSLIHIFNSGLVGWGFALAWQNRRPMALIVRYFIAVAIHGLWNGVTVMVGVASLPEQELVSSAWIVAGTAILLTLAVVCFVALIVINRRLRREEAHNSVSALESQDPLHPDSGNVPLDAGNLSETATATRDYSLSKENELADSIHLDEETTHK